MSRVRFEIITRASPDQVREALTDFTDRRPRIWNRTLDPKSYELRAQGVEWAVARESTAGSPFWVVCRYDWSDPTAIRWTIDECSWGGSGTGSVRVVPANSGGSRVNAEWTCTSASRRRDRLLLLLLDRTMSRAIAWTWTSALNRYARSGPG